MPLKRAQECWGTIISIDVRSDVDPSVLDECYRWFQRVDDFFSTWRANTEIMKIGNGDLRVENASPEVREVVEACEHLRLESHGAFDIRAGAHPDAPARPGRAPLDPSGFVKGWAVGQAATRLDEAGATCFSINAGGDVFVRGAPVGSAGWRVGIQHPWETGRVAAVVEVADRAVATSGRYERGDHVLTPATGVPATGMASVTVIGPDPGVADAYATAAVVLGPAEGMRWLATRVGYEGFGITDSRAVLFTPGFDRYRVS